MHPTRWLSAAILSAGLCTASFAADNMLTGTVKLDGKAPARAPITAVAGNKDCAPLHKDPLLDETVVTDDQGNLANVVVYLKGDNVKGKAPEEPATFDQEGCQYKPHVISMTVGQPLVAKSDDPFLHNIHTLPALNEPQNLAMAGKDQNGLKLKPVKAAEVIKVKCDVHPWMGMWIAVFDHPYHGVTFDDGTYEIDLTGLADGDYTVSAWHEKYKEIAAPQKVTVKGGKPSGPVNFTFKQAKAAADKPALPEAAVKLVSTSASADEACCKDGECKDKPADKVVQKPAPTAPVVVSK